jgi:hypothetical protein
LARATAIDSRRALRIISLNAASSRSGPIGHLVTAVSPLKTVRRTNFDQMSAMNLDADLVTGLRRRPEPAQAF